MQTRARREIGRLLEEAEGEGRFLMTHDRRLARNLQRAAQAGGIVRPHPGMYVRVEIWSELDPLERALRVVRTLALAHPTWVFAGPSAALLHGLSVSYRDVSTVYVVRGREHGSRTNDHVVRIFAPDDEPVFVDGVCVTSFLRTSYDCMRLRGFRRGLAVADSVLRKSGMTCGQLEDAVNARFRRRRGIEMVRAIVPYADARSENGGESMARAAMIELGYELPDLQREINDPIDGSTYYADYYWELGPGDIVVGELDGHDKYVKPEMTDGREAIEVLADERLRESRISARRVRVMRFSFRESQDDVRFRKILDTFGIPKRGA